MNYVKFKKIAVKGLKFEVDTYLIAKFTFSVQHPLLAQFCAELMNVGG